MPRIIDVDALLKDITHRYCENCDRRKGMKNGAMKTIYEIGEAPCRACGIGDMRDELDDAPTADAVEVVRCKDCESWGLNAIKKDEKGEVIYGDCLHFCVGTPKWFYCAWGERKNGQ